MNKFGDRLKELREEKGLTQTTLAKEVGYSQSAIARWEAYAKTPNIDIAITFAKYFKVSVDYIVGYKDF